jgi:putative ABC transport system permease protein
MRNGLPLRTALLIAWRESRASSARFLFVIMAVAVGVGSLNGVRGFSRNFRATLLKEARTLMAADVSVRVFELPDPEQLALFERYERRGVVRTQITETLSMLSAASEADPLLVGVKAVDPARYPFYGEVRLNPPAPLSRMLTPEAIAVSPDLLVRLNAAVGSKLRLGSQEFEIAGTIEYEPDRITGSMNVGPRTMISRAGLARTGLLEPGSRAAQRHIFRLPAAGVDVDEFRAALKSAFPRATIADYREAHPMVTRGLNRATTFLSLVSLVALIVGSIGVATAMHSHLQQKMDTIAVMKSIGGRSAQIILIFLVQTLLLAMAGAALGIAMGYGVQAVFPMLLASYFPIRAEIRWEVLSMAESLAVAILTTLLFTLPALLGIRAVRPSVILRREMSESQAVPVNRWRALKAPAAVSLFLIAGIASISVWLVGDPWRRAIEVAGWFSIGLAVSLLVLSGISWLFLRGLKLLIRARIWRLPTAMRHGIANLYRPGAHAQTILVALGVGVMFTLTVWLVQHAVIDRLIASAPPGMPNVFLINITDRDRGAVQEFLERFPGVTGKVEVLAAASGRLVSVDGQPVASRVEEGPARRFLTARSLTWAEALPEYLEVVDGRWWARPFPGEPQLAVSEEAARLLGIRLGSRVEFSADARTVTAVAAAVVKSTSVRPGSNVEFVFSPGALQGLPMLYFGGVRIQPQQVGLLQRRAFERFPAVTVINVADVLERVQEVIDYVALIVRFLSAFSIFAGAIILASSVAGTRFRRVREVVILKTLGATRRKVVGIFSIEFLLLGLVAGLMGSILATAFASLLLSRLFDANLVFDPVPNVVAICGTALLANAAGWLASMRILPQKPLEILRGA